MKRVNNMTDKDISKAYEILGTYQGENNQIRYYQLLYRQHKLVLEEFGVNYILQNVDYVPQIVNKVVGISSDFGLKLKEKHNLDFTPEKLKITKIIGEIGSSYHCYAQFRRSVEPQLMYVSKKYILNQLTDSNEYENMVVNFDKYDKMTEHLGRKIKDHQKTAVKFLLFNKKCVLADSMGLGKTTSAILAALCGNFKKILIITTASMKSSWKKEVALYHDPEDITILSGKKWDGSKKFTIINYDIVQNSYEVPMEPVFEEHRIEGVNGQVEILRTPVMIKSKSTGELVQKMQKTRKKEKILEALRNSPLFLNKFDCVIIDEAHKLSNNTSIRYNTISDFLKRAKPEAVFLLTGTPLTNKPINLYHILRLIDAPVTSDYHYYVKRYCDGKTFTLRDGREVTTANGATNLNELREKIKHLYIRRLITDVPGMVKKQILTKYYDLTELQKCEYDRLWKEYVEAQENQGNDESEKYRQLVEGMIVRQYLAKEMTAHTIELANSQIDYGEKVVIICTFQEEITILKDYYKKKAVVFDGTMTIKQKDKAVSEFMNNPKVQVFIGQIIACGVGLTLTASKFLIFNSYSWVAADNAQAQDRIYRLKQTQDVTCVYQLFTDSISQDMFEKVIRKELIMNETIKKEDDK